MKTYLHPLDGSEIVHMDEQDLINEEWAQREADAEAHIRANLDSGFICEAVSDMDSDALEDMLLAYQAQNLSAIGVMVRDAIDRYIRTCAELRVYGRLGVVK